MEQNEIRLPVIGMERHRLVTDGVGVTTLVGSYGCPLRCKYCINPHAWDGRMVGKCKNLTPAELYAAVEEDDLYFQATGGGITFGGGESLLHVDFIAEFRKLCPQWKLVAETCLNVSEETLRKAIPVIDEFIVDIKDMNPEIYKAYTGKDNALVLNNLRILAACIDTKKITIRIPLIPNHNTNADREKSLEALQVLGFTQFDAFEYIIKEK